MKKLVLLLMLGFSAVIFGQKPAKIAEALPGTEYGAGVAEDITFNVQSPDQVITALSKGNASELKDVIIQGEVSGVCEKKGCWITLKNSKNENVFVKMKDYAFFLPMSAMGKTVLLHADVSKKETSVKELQHYAEDQGKTKEEIAQITSPKMEYRVLAKGIKVVK